MVENFLRQYFSLPKHIIDQFCYSANHCLMRKLYKSCKYFYSKCRLSITDRIRVSNPSTREEEEFYVLPKYIPMSIKYIEVSEKELNLINFQFWITKELAIWNASSKFISKIVKCDIEALFLGCEITYSDFTILAQSGNITYFIYWLDNVLYDNKIPLEDIFELIPKANKIQISHCKVSKNTMTKILSLKRQTKISTLVLGKINQSLDVKVVDNFLKANLDDWAEFAISFLNEHTNEYLIKEIVKQMSLWALEERKLQHFPDIELVNED